jgi:hypothetical protein
VLRGIDAEEAAVAPLRAESVRTEPVVGEVYRPENDAAELPHDRPRWVTDAVAVSRAAREVVARLRPIAIRVLSVWDHRLHSVVVAGRGVQVDASGSYRLAT